MTFLYRTLLSIAFTLTSLSLAAGGGWPQPKGKGFLKLSEWWLISDQHYTDVGGLDPNITIGVFNTSLYAEYGLTDRITGVIYFPFFSRTYQNNQISEVTQEIIVQGEAVNGIGDTDISLKFGLSNPGSPIAVATTLTLGLPLGNDSGGSQGNLQLGDGEFNQMILLDAGTSWQVGSVPMYANAYTGYNNKTKGFSDEFRIGGEIGANLLNKRLWLIGRLNVVDALEETGSDTRPPGATSIFANNTQFTSVGAELSYNIGDNWGVSAGYATAVSGRIIFASPSYTAGVFTRF
ncbi:MAG: hypothetical protein AAFQ02_06360 [Bacteroidota bacterium]